MLIFMQIKLGGVFQLFMIDSITQSINFYTLSLLGSFKLSIWA